MAERKQKDSLSTQELDSVLSFSNALYNSGFGYGSFFATPFTQNQNLLRLNNNPAKPTMEKLTKALESVHMIMVV